MREHVIKPIMIYGAGHQGLSMAAHLSLNGEMVNLYNRSPEHIQKIIDTHLIECSGIITGEAKINNASDDISMVISDVIMVTTPSSAHKDVARQLAPYVHKEMIIILNPGRTFGAIEFAEELKKHGAKELPNIAETQTIVYTCRKSGENSTSIFALKRDVKIAAIQGSSIGKIMESIPDCLRSYFTPVNSVALTSFSNVGMILHCAPVMMNIGWIESEKVDFKYYYDGISRSVAKYIEKMDAERLKVVKESGFIVESLKEWLIRTYDVHGNNVYECITDNEAYREIDAPPTLNTRYIFEDIPNGLVPIEYLGSRLGVATPNITTIIDLACSVMDTDYRANGRRFDDSILNQYF